MNYYEYIYGVLAILLLSDRLVPEAHIWLVAFALLMVAIRRENSWPRV